MEPETPFPYHARAYAALHDSDGNPYPPAVVLAIVARLIEETDKATATGPDRVPFTHSPSRKGSRRGRA